MLINKDQNSEILIIYGGIWYALGLHVTYMVSKKAVNS
jgi:hypothetical protein